MLKLSCYLYHYPYTFALLMLQLRFARNAVNSDEAVMLKGLILSLCLLMCTATHAQECRHCKSGAFIYYKFMNFPRRYDIKPVFHYQLAYYYRQEVEDEKNKRSEVYNYLHNGDNLKMAQDVFTNDIRNGRTWIKYFDVGDFANLTLEVSPDRHNKPGALFQWTGQVIFFKLFHHKPLGRIKRRR